MVGPSSIKIAALLLAAVAVQGVYAGLCKPDPSQSSLLPTTTAPAAASTPTAPCPAYTLLGAPPSDATCGQRFSFDDSASYGLNVGSSGSTTSPEACAKTCADTDRYVSFYYYIYHPVPGVNAPICGMYSAQIRFSEVPEDGRPLYYDLSCFACDI